MEGTPPVLATASALNKEMLTTQNIPNKFKFSIGRKLIEIFQRMKKTVSTVLTALVKSDVKSRNSILGLQKMLFFFHGNTQGFSFRRSSLTVYLLLAAKKTNTKTKTKKTCDP